MLEPWQLGLLFVVAVAAGFVDSIAGGGGMLTVPALLGCGLAPQLALGTNKLQACFGSGAAAWRFARAGLVDWNGCRRGVLLTVTGAVLGAGTVQWLDPALLRRLIPVLLVAVALVLVVRPRLGTAPGPARLGRGPFDVACGLGIGFYDGFLGPGTGTFWAIACVFLLGFDLLQATARTKVMNFASNAGSLALFLAAGQVDFMVGLVMGPGQLLGARLGSQLVLRHGTGFVRIMLLAVTVALAAKLLLDAH